MNQWVFVVAAYGVTWAGSAALAIVSYRQMRRAEKPFVSGVNR